MSHDAGITVLELLVVLLLLAMTSTLVASHVAPQSDQTADPTALVEDLLMLARTQAVQSGRAVIVSFDTDGASYGDKHVSWDIEASGSPLLTHTDGVPTDRIVAFPDGSVSGPGLLSGKGRVLPSPNRRALQATSPVSLP